MTEQKMNALTEKVIGCAYAVHNELGTGFLEKAYENSLSIELQEQGIASIQQVAMPVYYKGALVGEYFADLLVADTLVFELKAVQEISKIHEVQLVNYLCATGKDVGLLINFGESVQVRRKYRVFRR
tara:strand:- start:1025 stop:1405 length:381 start_codon:yes stop_codon:yes gene_type:complete